MPNEILLLETKNFVPSESIRQKLESAGKVVALDNLFVLSKHIAKESQQYFIATGSTLLDSPELESALAKCRKNNQCLFFADTATLESNFIKNVITKASSAERSTGIKNFLELGSKIYFGKVFQLFGLGKQIDSSFQFMQGKLVQAKAINAIGAFYTTLQSALHINLESNSTNSMVDVQIGADEHLLAISVSFQANGLKPKAVLQHPLFVTAKTYADYVECRYLAESKQIEANLLFSLQQEKILPTLSLGITQTVAIERSNAVQSYQFVELNNLAQEEQNPKKFGFKKKFSEQVADIEETTKGRNTEILQGKVRSLETALSDALAREKELMGLADKSVQQKDEAVKRMKDVEARLRIAQTEKDYRADQLEKQIEEVKTQNQELLKKLAQQGDTSKAA